MTTRTKIPAWTPGDRLRKARESAGISTQEMADLLTRSRNTVGNWEADRTAPTDRVLQRWAELTGVPVWWLRGEERPARSATREDVTAGGNRPGPHAAVMVLPDAA